MDDIPTESPQETNSNGSSTTARPTWRRFFPFKQENESDSDAEQQKWENRSKWTLGILSDKETDEVPGTVLLLTETRNEPLGFQHQPARTSASSLPSPFSLSRTSSRSVVPQIKKTPDGRIILQPQPDDSLNDPLNWPTWRRDSALTCLGLYCMIGGGMTTILAAGFNEVASDYSITTQQVAYTTGLYMMGLGLGSVVMSPTAILYGKRPVYMLGATLFILSAVWCALSPAYPSLVVARIFQGIAVSPVECLPSATIAEIFFLHERAYRVGIYTLLLLGGKNLVPLVSAVIIESLGWRWVFWVVAIVVGGFLILLFFFVPETFWDRTPRPRDRSKVRRPSLVRNVMQHSFRGRHPVGIEKPPSPSRSPLRTRKHDHVGFVDFVADEGSNEKQPETSPADPPQDADGNVPSVQLDPVHTETSSPQPHPVPEEDADHSHSGISPVQDIEAARPISRSVSRTNSEDYVHFMTPSALYTHKLRQQPPIPYSKSLRFWNGRLAKEKWFRAAIRPFILFAYPAVLWSAMVYALSVGWLIVLSESVAHIYESRSTYNLTPLATGLLYISPFVGGILGTAVAGRLSDILVRWMARRNGGIYEPEFRLVMAIPVALATATGLMGFGWSAQEKDAWIVPTIFFGLISFGCTLGSTTSITFCVDSYRQYAGEALVTLNFSKNIFHGLVFSLFFVDWLEGEGAKDVFVTLGGIQLALLLTSIPMYIFGKRARMWTVRKNLMEKF